MTKKLLAATACMCIVVLLQAQNNTKLVYNLLHTDTKVYVARDTIWIKAYFYSVPTDIA